jgi:hypothetical protein
MTRIPIFTFVSVGLLALLLLLFVGHICWEEYKWARLSSAYHKGPVLAKVEFSAAKDNPNRLLPIPILAAVVQTAGLVFTLLLAYFPIHSVTYHQAKKHLLDEILRLLAQHYEDVETLYKLYYSHQTGVDATENESIEASRARIGRLYKSLQQSRERLVKYLPQDVGKEFLEAAHAWWNGMLGDDTGLVTAKNRRWKTDDFRCDRSWSAHAAFLAFISDLRLRCITDKVDYCRPAGVAKSKNDRRDDGREKA